MVQPFITEHLDAIAALCRTHHVRRLSVFGSAVRDDFDPSRSDVDLLAAFTVPDNVRYATNFFTLQSALASLLDRPVDLLIEGTIKNPIILRNVEAQKELLYAA